MDSLQYLQSPYTETVLNTIDELRSLGIGDVLELPQIIVCGDQSSGKSSVLNAVSTLRFPIKDTLCTRFATEVIMRPGEPNISASIVPSRDPASHPSRGILDFRKTNIGMDDIANVIEEATEAMGIDPRNSEAKRFSKDILRFEVTGPKQPSLTLVDLPGLFQAPSKDQTNEDTKSVRDLVLNYMKNKRSVILAVISAKSDFVLQSVTKYSRKIDPHGLRTLGIITKPDKLDVGSESEKEFVDLAENRSAYFHRGWHVLVNRDYTTRTYTQDQRDEAEHKFLSSGVWARLPSNHKGITTLRSRLSGLLRDQIVEELPGLIRDAEAEIETCKAKISKLGMPRRTTEERRLYLTRASQTFNATMRSCINGSYDDRFFGDAESEYSEQKRLRAVVQNTLLQFSDAMQTDGHAKHIVDKALSESKRPDSRDISQSDFEDEVVDLMRRNRGRELIGMYNPLIVYELFVMQSAPWANLFREYRNKVCLAAKVAIDLVLEHATDETTRTRLSQRVIGPSLDKLCGSLDEMIQRLLLQHQKRHPITYNRRLVESVQQAKQALAEEVFHQKIAQAVDTKGETVSKNTLEWLVKLQINIEPKSLERFAASEAIGIMRAYYKASYAVQCFVRIDLADRV